MQEWVYLTFITCAYGGLKALHPTTHFLTQYLEGPRVNLTYNQVNNEVYPIWTYSYLCFLPIVFLATAYIRHKPIIILESICLGITWTLLILVRTLWAIQLMQVIYGLATASEVGYDTYIYAKVPRDKYRRVTSYTRAAVLTGRLLSAVSGQILISTRILDYYSLNFVSLAFALFAFAFAILLPASHSTNFAVDAPNVGPDIKQRRKACKLNNLETVDVLSNKPIREVDKSSTSQRLWTGVKHAYSEHRLLEWSIWWALGTCGSLQVGNYIQTLWEEIYPLAEHEIVYNGAVDAIKTLLGTLMTLGLGHVKVDWDRYGEITLALAAGLEACVILIMSQTRSILVGYITYCIFHLSHHMLITIASFQVAKDLAQAIQPLVFGCNTFLALICQTILTAVVVDKGGLGLSPRIQFEVYAGYFTCISGMFWLLSFIRLARFLFKKELKFESGI